MWNPLKSLGKSSLPNTSEIGKIPKQLRTELHNTELNSIKVRFFNHNFTKVIESIGFISHHTAIPIIYFEKPHKAGIILFDDTSYYNIITKEMCIDVCESYPFAFDKNVDMKFDFDTAYYNDVGNGYIDKEKSKELKEKTGIGYYLPVFLNNIPIPIVKLESDVKIPFMDNEYVKLRTDITQHLLSQLADVKLLTRVSKQDNTGLTWAFLLGGAICSIITVMIMIYMLK